MKARLTLIMSFILLASFNINASTKTVANIDEKNSREHYYKSKDSFSAFEIMYKGKITISDNDKDVKAIEANGYLRITKSSFGNSRTIEIESNNNGNLTKKYFDGKKELPFEADGQEWLEEILPDVINKTGIGGKDRILRIYNKGGVNAVLNAAESLGRNSSYSYYKSTNHALVYFESVEYSGFNVRYMYYKTLVNDIKLNKEEVVKVLKALPEINSQSTKGILLREMLNKYDFDSYSMEKFLSAVGSLSYNTERGNTLRAFIKKYDITLDNSRSFLNVIERMSLNNEKSDLVRTLLLNQKLDKSILLDLIDVVDNFSSNSERASIYRIMLPLVVGDEKLTDELLIAIKNLSSSYHLLGEEILEWLAKGKPVVDNDLSESAVLNMLDVAKSYDANTRKSPALRKLYGSMTNNPKVLDSYFNVIRSMSIEKIQYNLLLDLLRVHTFDNYGYNLLFEFTEDLAKDGYEHEAAAILRVTIKDLPRDPGVLRSFFDVLNEIDQNSSKEEIIRMICDKGDVDKRMVVYLLKTAEDIELGVGKATAIINIKTVMPEGDDEINYILKSVAGEIRSDYEYERAIGN